MGFFRKKTDEELVKEIKQYRSEFKTASRTAELQKLRDEERAKLRSARLSTTVTGRVLAKVAPVAKKFAVASAGYLDKATAPKKGGSKMKGTEMRDIFFGSAPKGKKKSNDNPYF